MHVRAQRQRRPRRYRARSKREGNSTSGSAGPGARELRSAARELVDSREQFFDSRSQASLLALVGFHGLRRLRSMLFACVGDASLLSVLVPLLKHMGVQMQRAWDNKRKWKSTKYTNVQRQIN